MKNKWKRIKKFLASINVTWFLSIILLLTLIINPSYKATFTEEQQYVLQGPPTPPEQPLTGPGSSNYSHNGVRHTQYGWGSHQFWIFEPSDPTPTTAPLIMFNHGWSAFYPSSYEAWIDHLVKRGNIVIYPRYQLGLVLGVRYATQNAIQAVKKAIAILQKDDHVHPDLDKFAIVGHSLGGGITAETAIFAEQYELPRPKAIMPVQPFLRNDTMMKDFHAIPSTTLLLVVVGENDNIAGNYSGKLIFTSSDQIPFSRKDFIIQRTDQHGSPALVANHLAPICILNSSSVNAMDYYSTWKLFDALTDYAFYGTHQNFCLGNTSEQRFMGYWSDGTPVKELTVTDTP